MCVCIGNVQRVFTVYNPIGLVNGNYMIQYWFIKINSYTPRYESTLYYEYLQ